MNPVMYSKVPYSVIDRVSYEDPDRKILCLVFNAVEWFFAMGFLESTKKCSVESISDTTKFKLIIIEQEKEDFSALDLVRILANGFLCASWFTFLPLIGMFIGSRIFRGHVIEFDGRT